MSPSIFGIGFVVSENYETQSAYHRSLVSKMFFFRCVNAYATLFYIAFIKTECGNGCVYDEKERVSELRAQLGAIFMVQLSMFFNVFAVFCLLIC